MNTYQPQVPASRAALIYLLEPVFTSIVSVAVYYTTGAEGYDKLTLPLLLGGALVLAGNVLVEAPGWMKKGEPNHGSDGGWSRPSPQRVDCN
jgi:drug/metabolite transporter (DMT)-like permease